MKFPFRRTNAPDELEEMWDKLAEALEEIYVGIAERKKTGKFKEVREYLDFLEMYDKLRDMRGK